MSVNPEHAAQFADTRDGLRCAVWEIPGIKSRWAGVRQDRSSPIPEGATRWGRCFGNSIGPNRHNKHALLNQYLLCRQACML